MHGTGIQVWLQQSPHLIITSPLRCGLSFSCDDEWYFESNSKCATGWPSWQVSKQTLAEFCSRLQPQKGSSTASPPPLTALRHFPCIIRQTPRRMGAISFSGLRIRKHLSFKVRCGCAEKAPADLKWRWAAFSPGHDLILTVQPVNRLKGVMLWYRCQWNGKSRPK